MQYFVCIFWMTKRRCALKLICFKSKNLLVLEKHKEAAHESVELFCHNYNNKKDCPYEDECIYVRDESEN